MTTNTPGLSCSCGATILLTPGASHTSDDDATNTRLLALFRLAHDRSGHEVSPVKVNSITLTRDGEKKQARRG